MILNYMKASALDLLVSEIPNNTDRYASKEKWIDEYFEEKGIGRYYFNSMISVPDVDLTIGDSKTDYKNSVALYSALKDALSPVQASDLRLWAYLAHNTYWDYMRERWSIDIPEDDDETETGADKLAARIGSRYFFKASKGKAFVRQGIARLYWSAYLTYDADNSNPFEYTEYFLSKQDIFAVSTERSLARNKVLLLEALKVLKENPELKRADIRQFFLRLNQAGGLLVLDSLSPNSANELARRTLDDVMSSNIDPQELVAGEVHGAANTGQSVIPGNSQSKADASDKVVADKSLINAKNVTTGTETQIRVNRFVPKTEPELIGLKVGDTFKLRKNIWQIVDIK